MVLLDHEQLRAAESMKAGMGQKDTALPEALVF